MKKVALLIVLLASSTLAQAELQKVFENIRGTVVYADTNTLTVNGNARRVMEIQSYRTAGPRGMMSMKILKEYNCKEKTAQMLSYTIYSDVMATGSVIGKVESPGEIEQITKNPGGTGGYRFACER